MQYCISHTSYDIRTLVEVIFTNGLSGVLELRGINNIEDRIDFERHFKTPFRVTRIHKLPHSKIVIIRNKTLNQEQRLIVQETTRPDVYDLLERFSFGSYINGRETKYKNIFLVYEALEKNPEQKYIAVRHAISHPKLSNFKTKSEIKLLFNAERINLKKRSHNLIFRKLCGELEEKAHNLLSQEVYDLYQAANQFIDKYRIV